MLDHTPKACGYSLPKVKCTLLLKLLAASCVLHGASATAATPAASGLSSHRPSRDCAANPCTDGYWLNGNGQ